MTLAGVLLLYGPTEQAPIEPWLALLVALYSLAAQADRRVLTRGLAIAAPPAIAISVWETIEGAAPGNVWPSFLFYAVALAFGRGIRGFRLLTRALEREREETARLAVLDERARVARELHDVIAHSVSIMVVQAAGERLARPDAPGSTADALGQIERTGREALVELRRLLGVLRRSDEDAALAPLPGLGRLDGLLEQVRDAGLPVALRVEGEPAPLAPGLDVAAYRIVQEALTNTLKHAHAQRAEVVVTYGADALGLDVRDDGSGNGGAPTAPGGGHGLAGLHERVSLHGGELVAGRRAGGFEVRARLPYAP